MISRFNRNRKRKIPRRTRWVRPTTNFFRGSGKSLALPTRRQVHFFKRTYHQSYTISTETGSFTPLLTADAGGYNVFKATDLPSYTDFSSLYDQFKICGIKRKYVFNSNSQDFGGAPAIPRLLTVNDFTDSTVLSDEDEGLEFGSCKISRLDKVRSRYFKPAINIEDANQGNLQVVRNRWIETATGTGMDQAYHGLKEALLYDSAGTAAGILHIYTTMYIACKTPR